MEKVKIHFTDCPKEIDYRMQEDGFAEVWIYKDIHTETDIDGNTEFVADGVFIKTKLSEEEILEQKNSYFEEEAENVTVYDLVEALGILTSIVLGGE